MEKKNKVISEDKKFEFVFLYRAYLITAYRNIDEILEKTTKNTYINPFGEITPDWVYERNILMFPAMFNLKHAIEMFLKAMRHFLNLTEITDGKNGHNLKFIFEDTEPSFKKIFADKTVTELKEIILKYHEMNRGNRKIIDQNNTVFRYSEDENSLDLFSDIKEDDLLLIKLDLKKFDEYFYKIGEEILKLKYGQCPSKEVLMTAKLEYLKLKK